MEPDELKKPRIFLGNDWTANAAGQHLIRRQSKRRGLSANRYLQSLIAETLLEREKTDAAPTAPENAKSKPSRKFVKLGLT